MTGGPTRRRPADTDTGAVCSAAAVLERWTAHDWSRAVHLAHLPALAAVEIVTKHSVYHLVAGSAPGSEVLVRGGRFLPEFRRARAVGCSLGGALLKQHAVDVGFRMELAFDDMRLVTSEICAIRLLPECSTRTA
jgi:hypothetical protein